MLDLNKQIYSLEDVINIVKILRGENGCPWDRVQTHETLKDATLEEAYEVIEAINNKDVDNLKEELGDLLLHVIFHSAIAEDNDDFVLTDVTSELAKKLIRRHPHVFKDQNINTPDEVMVNWNQIKKEEKNFTSYTEAIKNVPKAMPALVRAAKVQNKVKEVGFDFDHWQQSFDKIHEELDELNEAVVKGDNCNIMEEFGDVLFSLVNFSRFFKLNPEFSLTNATEKFITRFEGIEKIANERSLNLEDMTLSQLDKLWNEVKNS